jgi:hypothetical protein
MPRPPGTVGREKTSILIGELLLFCCLRNWEKVKFFFQPREFSEIYFQKFQSDIF